MALEDDGLAALAFRALKALRDAHVSADLIATGSPRKRFDKAMKINAGVLASVTRDREGRPVINTRSATATDLSVIVENILAGVAR